MKILIKNQFNKKYITEKIEINYYRNKMITERKETQIIKKYLDPMLIYKIKLKALEENLSRNDSENKQNFHRWNIFQTT